MATKFGFCLSMKFILAIVVSWSVFHCFSVITSSVSLILSRFMVHFGKIVQLTFLIFWISSISHFSVAKKHTQNNSSIKFIACLIDSVSNTGIAKFVIRISSFLLFLDINNSMLGGGRNSLGYRWYGISTSFSWLVQPQSFHVHFDCRYAVSIGKCFNFLYFHSALYELVGHIFFGKSSSQVEIPLNQASVTLSLSTALIGIYSCSCPVMILYLSKYFCAFLMRFCWIMLSGIKK